MSEKQTDSLGDRMKAYESAYRFVLPNRLPVIIRIDGKAFHTYTKGCKRPFDTTFMEVMNEAAIELCSEVQGSQLAYVQSDEISLLVHSYKRLCSSAWFDNQIQKMVSVAASIAGSCVTAESSHIFGKLKRARFDARAYVVPESDVCNYFLWRQQDATRNSVLTAARSMFSHSALNGKSCAKLLDMMLENGTNWNDLPTEQKRGRCVARVQVDVNGTLRSKWTVDREVPIFSQNRSYINQHLVIEED